MIESLTAGECEQTKEKLRDLQARLAEIEHRTDLGPAHLASVRRSYDKMIREYLQAIRFYETKQAKPDEHSPE
jgi:CRISPR/Cas system-associated endoribonuclease Cas2